MKNSIIVSFRAKDDYEWITAIFETTKELSKVLRISEEHCRSIICRKINHKGFRYERIWLNRDFGDENG